MQKKSHDQDEIDILELLAKFYTMLRQNLLLVVGFPVAGMLVAFSLNKLTPGGVVSEMMAITSYLSESECNFLMEQLESADSIPGLPDEFKNAVVSISHETETERNAAEPNMKVNESRISVRIKASVKKFSVLPELQEAIVNYLDSSEPVTRKRKNEEVYLNELITKIVSESDSLQEVKGQLNNTPKVMFLNPSDLFVQAVQLYDTKVQYEIRLKNIQQIEIVQGFTDMPKNAGLSSPYSLGLGFLGGCLVLAFVLFMKFFSSYYKQYQSTID